MNSPKAIIDFWFSDEIKKAWFASTPEIDTQMREQFNDIWEQAKSGELDHWKQTGEGCLALCIILDQLPLNIFRGKAKSFSTEQQAVAIAKYAIEEGLDLEVEKERVSFLYMPLMHSENLDDQNLSVESFEKAELEDNLRFAKHHRDLVIEFGRFPHRNEILNRESSEQEVEYLNSKRAFKG